MRVFSYILTTLVTIFVLNIALSFSLPAYRDALIHVRTSIFPNSEKIPENGIAEEKKSENARLVESLDRIDRHIETLSEARKSDTEAVAMSGAVNKETDIVTSASGITASEEENTLAEPDIALSGLFLSKIMPEITPKKVENS